MYYNPYVNQYPQVSQTPVQYEQRNEFAWVQGEAGARGYMVPAGRTVWLMDSENPVFYLKSTDQNGIPQPLRVFDFKERTVQQVPAQEQTQYVTKDEMKAYIAEILKERSNEPIVQPETNSVTVSELPKHAD